MKKFSKFTLAALVASSIISTASANWYDGVFIGAEGKYNFKSELETSWNIPIGPFSYSSNVDESSFGLGLKVGYDFDFMRVYGAYNHNFEAKATDIGFSYIIAGSKIPEEFKHSGKDFIIGADWTPKFSLGGLDFKGILGAFAGISKIDVEYYLDLNPIMFTPNDDYHKADYSQDGFIYGLKLGAIYDLDKFGEVEFGFKYDQAKYDDIDTQLYSRITSGLGTNLYADTMKVSDTKRTNMGLFIGYNYKF